MSFASEVKNELCRVPVSRHCCAVAEAYGVLLYCHTFTTREIRIVTACDAFAERLPKLFRRAFGAHFALPTGEKAGGRHVLTITDRAAVETVFAARARTTPSSSSRRTRASAARRPPCSRSWALPRAASTAARTPCSISRSPRPSRTS